MMKTLLEGDGMLFQAPAHSVCVRACVHACVSERGVFWYAKLLVHGTELAHLPGSRGCSFVQSCDIRLLQPSLSSTINMHGAHIFSADKMHYLHLYAPN